jgi:hypothetical protein
MANWKEEKLDDYSVIGVDVGSTATGFCRIRQGLVATHQIRPKGDLLERCIAIRAELRLLLAGSGKVDIICVEKPYSMGMKAAKALAAASIFIEEAIYQELLTDKMVMVPPAVWQKYVRDNVPGLDLKNPGRIKGKTKKVLHTALSASVAPGISTDESDAYWLARYGYDLKGKEGAN